jgi:hypothetical protein
MTSAPRGTIDRTRRAAGAPAALAVSLLSLVLLAASCSSSTSPDDPSSIHAHLSVSPASGTIITDFTLDASGSGAVPRALEYRWDWNNDGTWDTDWSDDATVSRRFDRPENARIAVLVTDGADGDVGWAKIGLDLEHGSVVSQATLEPGFAVLGSDGTSLWVSNWNHHPALLFEIDPATGATIRPLRAPSDWPCGIAWDGTSLWVTDYIDEMKMFRLDPSDGTVLSFFPVVYSHSPGGLVWDGQYFYHGSWWESGSAADGKIHKYTNDGTHVAAFDTPGGYVRPNGLAHDGENLWVSVQEADTLYVVDPDDGSVLRSVHVADSGGRLAVLGDHVWVGEASHTLLKVVP